MRAGTFAGLRAGAGSANVLGGILLFVPGFITDLVGLVVLVPPLRRGLGGMLRQLWTRYRRPAPSPEVIDLQPGEWHEVRTRKRMGARTGRRTGKRGPKRPT
jgi:UPF0716 family protein affecting phage T7 exclusion